jgi:carbon starvation protein
MTLLPIALVCAALLTTAYLVYGRVLSRLLKLDPNVETPAVTMRDGLDYEPIEPKFLMSQHFSAIAAAGPIVGPIAAGLAFGWVPALAWILFGSIFIGGVHDMTALTASVRHGAGSIAEVVHDHMSRRSFLMFLSFVWIALVYIIVAFTDVTTAAFVGRQDLGGGVVVDGPAIASSSLMYLVLPIVMGLLLRYTKLSLNLATWIFLPLVGATIYLGPMMPFDIGKMFGIESQAQVQNVWDVALLIYCLVAAVVPVWLLLQPRGHLGGYFLYVALGGAAIGLLFGGHTVKYPAFTNWVSASGQSLFPFLFITIACGACSGFHSLIASGTTSKQLRRETDARPIGYGAMLLEAMVAFVSLTCVMMWTADAKELKGGPNVIYAIGMGEFLDGLFGLLHIPPQMAISFALMAFTTFVYDTLDVCTRLGRYIIQELTGWKDAKGRWLGTGLTAGVPLYFLLQPPMIGPDGKEAPLYRVFWNLFGASNQLLAALTLLGVTVWLWRTRRETWVWLVTGLPCVWMYAMSSWALVAMTWPKFIHAETGSLLIPKDPVPWIGCVLLTLAALMLVEAVLALTAGRRPPTRALPIPNAAAAAS